MIRAMLRPRSLFLGNRGCYHGPANATFSLPCPGQVLSVNRTQGVEPRPVSSRVLLSSTTPPSAQGACRLSSFLACRLASPPRYATSNLTVENTYLLTPFDVLS